MFAEKIKIGDDAPNDFDKKDNLDDNKESKHKFLVDEQLQKQGKVT